MAGPLVSETTTSNLKLDPGNESPSRVNEALFYDTALLTNGQVSEVRMATDLSSYGKIFEINRL
jgi:hypothetical protein